MSGILGIIHLDGRPVAPAQPSLMHRILSHRGPDGADTWLDGPVALGHLMLHTTPESLQERLPEVDQASGVVITADARIDNRDQLFKDLSLCKTERNISDSRLIVRAYLRWRERCAEHLLGDFAFAIWEPAARRLYVARDGMGLRPFYYALTGSLFGFASSAAAVAAVSGAQGRIDEGRLADLLVQELEGVDKTSTFFRGVHRMPPAHWGLLQDGRFSLCRYWQPNPEKRLRFADDRDYVDGLEEVLEQSIEARLRSQRPTASMLSGGVDSSTIVGLAARLLTSRREAPFAVFSGVSQAGENCLESEYSNIMSQQLSLATTRLPPSAVHDFQDALDHVESVLEDPFDHQWILLQTMYLAAKQRGHAVVMDGIDGDGVAGLTKLYPAYLARRGKLATALLEIDGQRAHFYRASDRRLLFYWHGLKPALTPGIFRRLSENRAVSRWVKAAIERTAIGPDFAARAGLFARYRQYRRATFTGIMKNLRHAHAHRLDVPYLTAGIERYGRIAAYCGVEARQPLHDRRVIEYCLALPWNLKARDGWTKFALRKVCERVCPAEVAWRPGWEQIGWKFNFERQVHRMSANLELLQQARHELHDMLAPRFLSELVPSYAQCRPEALEGVQSVIAYLQWNRTLAMRVCSR